MRCWISAYSLRHLPSHRLLREDSLDSTARYDSLHGIHRRENSLPGLWRELIAVLLLFLYRRGVHHARK